MIYRTIRLTLERFEKFFAELHKLWLEIPKKISKGINFTIKTLEQLESELLYSTEGGIESQFFPKIVNHTSGGEIHVNVPPVEVRLFRDVSFVFGSNFLRFSDNKVFHKKFESESIFSDLGDQDLLARRDNKYRLRKYEKNTSRDCISCYCSFQPTGSFSAEYFPRMEYLKVLNAQDKRLI